MQISSVTHPEISRVVESISDSGKGTYKIKTTSGIEYNVKVNNSGKAYGIEFISNSPNRLTRRELPKRSEGFEVVSLLNEGLGNIHSFFRGEESRINISGSRGRVTKNGEVAEKTLHTEQPGDLSYEKRMFDSWSLSVGRNETSALKGNGRVLCMPFRNGVEPSESEVSNAISRLHCAGFFMADPCPSNFIKTSNGVVPVDFGLVFSPNDLENIPEEIKRDIVNDYINGGYKLIPDELRESYRNAVNTIDKTLTPREMGYIAAEKKVLAGFSEAKSNPFSMSDLMSKLNNLSRSESESEKSFDI